MEMKDKEVKSEEEAHLEVQGEQEEIPEGEEARVIVCTQLKEKEMEIKRKDSTLED